jgi:hypothetical protein
LSSINLDYTIINHTRNVLLILFFFGWNHASWDWILELWLRENKLLKMWNWWWEIHGNMWVDVSITKVLKEWKNTFLFNGRKTSQYKIYYHFELLRSRWELWANSLDNNWDTYPIFITSSAPLKVPSSLIPRAKGF